MTGPGSTRVRLRADSGPTLGRLDTDQRPTLGQPQSDRAAPTQRPTRADSSPTEPYRPRPRPGLDRAVPAQARPRLDPGPTEPYRPGLDPSCPSQPRSERRRAGTWPVAEAGTGRRRRAGPRRTGLPLAGRATGLMASRSDRCASGVWHAEPRHAPGDSPGERDSAALPRVSRAASGEGRGHGRRPRRRDIADPACHESAGSGGGGTSPASQPGSERRGRDLAGESAGQRAAGCGDMAGGGAWPAATGET